MKIHVAINKKTGEVEYEIEGIVGAKCTDLTSLLQKGHQILEEQYTEDYYTPSESPAFVTDL